jgi:hypothetical protein
MHVVAFLNVIHIVFSVYHNVVRHIMACGAGVSGC